MRLLELWDDVEAVNGDSGRKYYRLATITWSRPRLWPADQRAFDVPEGWAGKGGVYAFLRRHWKQAEHQRVAYVGKAINFSTRLTNSHNHFDLIRRRGDTLVSCGRVAFERIRPRTAYYLEIEDVIKFALYHHLENKQGFESLPGFRASTPQVMAPWVIRNEGYRFGGWMPKRIAYPAIGVEY